MYEIQDTHHSTMPPAGIIRVVLTNFRSYPKLSLSCDTRPIVLTGPNGIGKTNLLEAISYLSPGRGLRNAKLAQVTYLNHQYTDMQKTVEPQSWAVAVTYLTEQQGHYLGTGLQYSDGKEKRVVQIDGELVKTQAKLTDYVNILWLTPQMDRLFAESSSLKRQFFDRLVYGFDPEHAVRLHRYEHYMRERNDLLYKNYGDKVWLTTLEQKMAQEAVAIAATRKWLLTQLQVAESWTLGLMATPLLNLEGEVENLLDQHKALIVEELFAEKLSKNRVADQNAGRALSGVHRTDLRVTHVTKMVDAEYCSTGEQKAMIMMMIMATARLQAHHKKTVPLLLLDETAAHFDKTRRNMLFAEILDLRMQVWMTGAEAEVFASLGDKVQHFQVDNGSITLL